MTHRRLIPAAALWLGIVLFVGVATLSAQTANSRAPRSAEELASRFRQAQSRGDLETMKGLFYWGSSTDTMRMLVASFLQHDISSAITRASITALDADDMTSYTQNGVQYRLTLTPVAKLRIDYRAHDVPGGHVNEEHTSYFVGTWDGAYWLLTAEPAKRSVPPSADHNDE